MDSYDKEFAVVDAISMMICHLTKMRKRIGNKNEFGVGLYGKKS
jgi:hypothetical protein